MQSRGSKLAIGRDIACNVFVELIQELNKEESSMNKLTKTSKTNKSTESENIKESMIDTDMTIAFSRKC